MDTVRFGRVLGHGARQAAKTLVSAVDAATAPNPSSPASTPAASPTIHPPAQVASQTPSQTASRAASSPRPPLAPSSQAPAAQPLIGTVLPPAAAARKPPVVTTTRGLAEGSRRFGRAVWGPAVRLSGVLWLEVTGVFFGLFALIAGIATWKLHTAVFAVAAPLGMSASQGISASDDRTRFFFAAGMVLVFGYFSLSSFLKANRRSRRP